MILSVIFHFLKTVFGYAVKIIAWLLVALSLWVPLLYAVIFVVVCGLTETPLPSVQGWFWGGLAVSFIGSFLVSTLIYERRIAKKKRAKTEPVSSGNIEKVKEKQDETLIKKRDGELITDLAAADGQSPDPIQDGYQGYTPVTGSPAGGDSFNNQTDNPSAGPSLMDRLKQGAPQHKANDTAAKHNFISYDSLNGSGFNNQNNSGGGLSGGFDDGASDNSSGGYHAYNNQGGYQNQGGFGQGTNNQGGFGQGTNNQGGSGFGNQDAAVYTDYSGSVGGQGFGSTARNAENPYQGGFGQGVNNQGGFGQGINNQGGFGQGINNQGGFGQGINNQGGFGQGINNQGGFGQGINNQGGFGQGINNQGGFGNRDGYQGGFGQGGFSRGGDGGTDAGFGRSAPDALSRGFEDGYQGGLSGRGENEYRDENGEKPKIFVTRSDPTILIYEYSGRLEYYKRTRSGLLLFKTRQKEASGE